MDYRDAPLWRMRAGMGDTVFTPFYDVLRARGVTINLFHRLTGITPAAGNANVATITLERQADFVGPSYDPIVVVKGLRCWPDQPDWMQLMTWLHSPCRHPARASTQM